MKLFKIFSISILAAALLNSCLVDDDVPANIESTPYIVGFDQAAATNSYFEDIGAVEKQYAVSLKGSPDGRNYDRDIVLNYSVDSASTAVEGEEFDFVNNTGTLVIPANSNFALLPIYVNTGSLDPDGPTSVIINLSATSDDAVVSAQYSRLTITFVGCQSQLEGNYLVSGVILPDNNSYSMGVEPVVEVAANTFHTLTTGPWPAGSQGPDQGFSFEDICGNLTILPDQFLMNMYSNTWGGVQYEGSPTGVHGVVTELGFEIHYTIVFATGTNIYEMTYIRQ